MIQNMTLHGGLDAGLFTLHGDVKTLDVCTKYCCNDKHCDIAFMVDDACYSVQCKDEESCTPVETSLSKTKVSLAFISRGNRQPIIGIILLLWDFYTCPSSEMPKNPDTISILIIHIVSIMTTDANRCSLFKPKE
jgi:hypothetical protein